MDKYTFAVIQRDAQFNLVRQGRVTVMAESADEAKADLLDTWTRTWPNDDASDIEIHEVVTIQRRIITS